MAIRTIVTREDESLRRKSREVTAFDARLHALLDDMKETLIEANGVGLAAPQVGILRRIAIVMIDDFYIELINPVIVEASGEQTDAEGCLSVPGIYGTVSRPNFVRVRAFDRDGNEFEVEGEELAARAFCHEIDHLDGNLFTDKVIEYVEN